MAVVKEYISEAGAHIKINDEYCRDKSQEEIKAILSRVSQIYMDAAIREQMKE